MESIVEKMLLIRRVEEEIIACHSKQLMRCPLHLSLGQEAIAVGVCYHLKPTDKVFSTHRSHGHYLAKGGSLEKMALEIHGKIGGCQDGRGGSMHLNDDNILSIPIVASAIPLAVGAALAEKINGTGNIVVCFFGDAAVEEGVFHESMNFSSLMQLPIIFVCENNQYSVDTPLSKRQPKRDFAKLANAHTINQWHIKTEDVFIIANTFEDMIKDVRKRNKPKFIVFDTQRSHVHCGVDKEFELDVDPIDIAISGSGLSDIQLHSLENDIKNRITKAFDAAEAAPLPTPEMAKEHVYG